MLKQFIHLNQGRLEVFSHEAYGKIDGSGEVYQTRPTWFEGTLVNIALKCDDQFYCLASEVADEPLF